LDPFFDLEIRVIFIEKIIETRFGGKDIGREFRYVEITRRSDLYAFGNEKFLGRTVS
jgi:hypothetical protein